MSNGSIPPTQIFNAVEQLVEDMALLHSLVLEFQALIPTTTGGMKQAVVCATTAAITLSGAQTIDGVAVTDNDRVLVKNQASAPTNGIYVVSSTGSWTRALDMNVSGQIAPGMMLLVRQGTANGLTLFRLSGSGPFILGTTNLNFVAFITGT